VSGAVSADRNPIVIRLDVDFRPLGIPYDDRRRVIVVV